VRAVDAGGRRGRVARGCWSGHGGRGEGLLHGEGALGGADAAYATTTAGTDGDIDGAQRISAG
jgi:hypothetical protein